MQSHEMLFDAHYHAFVAFGGVPERGIYDNMKAAVDKVRKGKQRDVNKRFTAMVSHYLFEAEFCNPAAGWEKGQIEKNVLDSRRRIWAGAPYYLSVVQRKPGALRNGAPFNELPESFKQLQKKRLKRPGGDREMVDVLALVLLHDEQQVEQAVSEALKIDRPSKQHVVNCLSRITETPKPEPTQRPAALKLVTEPTADVHRYDRLRRKLP